MITKLIGPLLVIWFFLITAATIWNTYEVRSLVPEIVKTTTSIQKQDTLNQQVINTFQYLQLQDLWHQETLARISREDLDSVRVVLQRQLQEQRNQEPNDNQ